ncbi:hypothetical protein RvY_04011 [Ramazzottius varieornatus]|uniref:Peptidase M12A domain-containing protein n=1 Tax=Ramazzottius varieornatus TaxID=947166 RepID=A0A1D1UTJ2_RAMVA|nr:hypothetical protein RvY_04011 [Ramazzottius varieornatus]
MFVPYGISLFFGLWIILTNCYHAEGYVLNTNPTFAKWPGNTVPFLISPEYSPAEQSTIRLAAAQLQADMGNCIRFVDLTNSGIPTNTHYVIISKSGGPGVPASSCYSFPGMVVSPSQPPPSYAQHMAIQNGPGGCLSSTRQVMRFLASVLGLRGEHNKPGRDNFIQINIQNVDRLAPLVGAFNEYDPRTVAFNATDFDYNSISMLDPLSYSRNGAPVIVSRNGRPIFNGGRLSFRDCYALSLMYGCMVQCPTFY